MTPTIDQVITMYEEARMRADNALANTRDVNRLINNYINLPLENLEETAKFILKRQTKLRECHITCLIYDIEELKASIELGEKVIGRKTNT